MADYTDSTGKRDTTMSSGGAIPEVDSAPVADNVYIPVGTLVGLDSAGRATPVSANWIGGPRGIARADYDNTVTGHTAGGITAEFFRGIAQLDNSATTDALTAADKGNLCYVVDNHTVARTSAAGTRLEAGIFEGLGDDGTSARVRVGTSPLNRAGFDIELLAAADLRTKQFFAVKVNSAAAAALCGAGDFACGILQNAPNTGEVAKIRVFGISKFIAAAAQTIGAQLESDSSGKAKASVKGVTDTSDTGGATDPLLGGNVLGTALTAGGTDTALYILLTHSGAIPTTAS